MSSQAKRAGWVALYGRDCAERLQLLAAAAGEDAVHSLLNSKLRVRPYCGLYIRAALEREKGRRFVNQLIEDLLQGQQIPVASVAGYYATGRQIPAGMRLAAGALVDVPAERVRRRRHEVRRAV